MSGLVGDGDERAIAGSYPAHKRPDGSCRSESWHFGMSRWCVDTMMTHERAIRRIDTQPQYIPAHFRPPIGQPIGRGYGRHSTNRVSHNRTGARFCANPNIQVRLGASAATKSSCLARSIISLMRRRLETVAAWAVAYFESVIRISTSAPC